MKMGICTLIILVMLLLSTAAPIFGADDSNRTGDNDNNFENATQIDPGNPTIGNLSSYDDPVDFYKCSGNYISVFNATVTVMNYPSATVRLIIYNKYLWEVARSEYGGSVEIASVIITYQAPYFFKVEITSGASCDYMIVITMEDTQEAFNGDTRHGNLSAASENAEDWYRINLNADVAGQSDLLNLTINHDSSLHLDAYIYSVWTGVVECLANYTIDAPSGSHLTSIAVHVGNLFIKIRARSGTGGYSLKFSVSSYPSDNNNNPRGEKRITSTTITDTIHQSLDHYDLYKFFLDKDETFRMKFKMNKWVKGLYRIILMNYTDAYHPVRIANNSDGSGGWLDTINIDYTPPASALHVILVEAAMGDTSSAWCNYTITIESPQQMNHAPRLRPGVGTQVMDEDTKYYRDLDELFYDPDGDSIDYRATGSKHLSVSLLFSKIEVTPAKDWAGTEEIEITAIDSLGAEIVEKLRFHVINQNDRPKGIKEFSEINIYEENVTTLDLSEYFADPDIPYGDRLTYFVKDNGSVPMACDENILTIGPVYNWYGKVTAQVFARDKKGYQVSQDLSVNVIHINHPPSVSTDKIEIEMNEDDVYRNINVNDYFSDVDMSYAGDKLIFKGINSRNINCTVLLNGTVVISPRKNWYGQESVYVVATDVENDSASLEIAVNVRGMNDPPHANNITPDTGNLTMYETETIIFIVNASDVDDDDSSLRYVWRLNGEVLNVTGNRFNFTPGYDDAGAYTLILEISDGKNATEFEWYILVYDMNRPPVVNITSPEEDVWYTAGEEIELSAEIYDPDGDEYSLSWKVDGKTVGRLQTMRIKLDGGLHNISVNAWDEHNAMTVIYVITHVNTPPTVRILSPLNHTKPDGSKKIELVADIKDADKDSLNITWYDETEKERKILGHNSTEKVKLNPGKHRIVLEVSDGKITVIQWVEIDVKAPPSRQPGMMGEIFLLTLALLLIIRRMRI